MDADSNQVPGMSLSQPLRGQDSSAVLVGGVQPGETATVAAGTPQTRAQIISQTASSIQVADETASDEELDQEWVNKAKDIVEQTKADPFAQSNELNRVKAEYLKTRFNKELNVSDKPSQ